MYVEQMCAFLHVRKHVCTALSEMNMNLQYSLNKLLFFYGYLIWDHSKHILEED